MQLTEEQRLIQESAKRFSDEELAPRAAERDLNKQFPHDALARLGELGFLGMLIPEEFDGVNAGYVAYVLALEEIAAGDGAVSTIMSVHNSVATLPLLQFGSIEQKNKFLKPMAQGKLLGAFCLSEPQAGSDARNICTKAKKTADGFVLNGVKQFITSGQDADLAIVFASTGKDMADREISAFLVPTDAPGYTVTRVENKMGQHAAITAQITLDNVHVPSDHLLGEIGQGYKIALQNLESGRIGIGAQAIGMARSAFRCALAYAKEREAFGKTLIDHQAIGFRLADMATELSAAQLMVMNAAQLRDNQQPCQRQAAMAKLFATEVAERVCREAIQIHGGYGYLSDFPVERIYRDVRVCTIYEGTSDIQRMVIVRELNNNDGFV